MKKLICGRTASRWRPCAPQTIVIKNATVMTVTKGTFKGSVVVKDGKIARGGRDR